MNANLILLLAVTLYRSQGEAAVERMLTPSQATLKGLPGRQNQDVPEIQAEFDKAAKQFVKAIESIYQKGFTPDETDALIAHLAA